MNELCAGIDRAVGTIYLRAFEIGGRAFSFSYPVAAVLHIGGNLWSVDDDGLGCLGIGCTKEEALQDFARDLAATWDGYTAEDDGHLDFDAIRLKRKLCRAVARVVRIA